MIYYNISQSGGGDIYKGPWNRKEHIFKLLKANAIQTVEEQIQHIKNNWSVFKKLSENKFLVVPLAIIELNERLVGYIMQSVPNPKSLDLLCRDPSKDLDVLKYAKKIISLAKNITSTNLRPNLEHGGNILVDQENEDLYIIDLDELKSSYTNDRSTIEELSTIFINCYQKRNWDKLFEKTENNEKVKGKFQNFNDILELQ